MLKSNVVTVPVKINVRLRKEFDRVEFESELKIVLHLLLRTNWVSSGTGFALDMVSLDGEEKSKTICSILDQLEKERKVI